MAGAEPDRLRLAVLNGVSLDPAEPSRLPVVLSPDEVVRFPEAASSLKSRTTVCAAGPRVSEVVLLKIANIDSQRMVIRVERGKGGKDRCVCSLRNY